AFLIFLSSSTAASSRVPLAPTGLPRSSIARAIDLMVRASPGSPVPLSPPTRPRPCNTFSSWPFTRQMLRSRVSASASREVGSSAAKARTMASALSHAERNIVFESSGNMTLNPKPISNETRQQEETRPALKRLVALEGPVEPAAGVAVANLALFAFVDREVKAVGAADFVVGVDEPPGNDTAERLYPHFFVDFDFLVR